MTRGFGNASRSIPSGGLDAAAGWGERWPGIGGTQKGAFGPALC